MLKAEICQLRLETTKLVAAEWDGNHMKVLVTGGTGFIGRHLIKHLKHHADVTVLSRTPHVAYRILGHDIQCTDTLPSQPCFNQFEAVFNLAGERIDKRWTDKQKKLICDSRWQLTEQLAERIQNSPNPPVFISGSAIGYYGSRGDEMLDETSQCNDPSNFAHGVCQQWEELARSVSDEARVCIIRTGVVLSPQNGALKRLLTPFKLGLGGPIASGEQYMSWIHIEDMVRLLIFLLKTNTTYGTFNATAPNPVTNAEFSEILARTLHRPQMIRTPELALKFILGEMANLLTQGQRVYPKRLISAGFKFHHPHLEESLQHLLHKKCR